MKAKITRLSEDIELPKYHTEESAAFDIAISEDAEFQPGEIKLIKTGLIIEAPVGHFLLIAARSSLVRKKGLKLGNGIGVIDRDYSGPEDEISLILENISKDSVSVKKGDRLAQGMFIRVDQVEWQEVDTIRESARGGYGSTGGYTIE